MERDANPEVSEGREVSVRGGTKYSQEEDPDLKEKEAVEKDQAKLGQVEGSDAVNMVMTEGAMEGDLNTTDKAREAMEDEVTPRNKTKKKTRRRKTVVTVEDGRLPIGDSGLARSRRTPKKMSLVWPRREGIITQDMSAPNHNIVGYVS